MLKIPFCAIALLLATAPIGQAQVTITEYPASTSGRPPARITAGPDGNLWFTNCRCSSESSGITTVGKITTAGIITEYALPDAHLSRRDHQWTRR